ncbi:transcription factor ILR3-like isoform X3 [Cucurbita maxima]|uniref:Transcription factor ILR3-like isoform X3 n=1 Tax=Cucurbita maxima TaxID=3661 RepID=A0A6J1JG93_CUCMA|nr:transcription factor ILR3-like isoform X3 [Cucurbita maxima]
MNSIDLLTQSDKLGGLSSESRENILFFFKQSNKPCFISGDDEQLLACIHSNDQILLHEQKRKQKTETKSLEVDCSYEDLDSLKEVGRKRLKAETSSASTSKAWREKLRRDKLNERFLELSAVLEPGKLPKTDKVAILSDAIRMMTDLQCEIEKLKESEDDLKEKIKELKVEKNELRDEKQRLRAEKEKLEVQIKAVNARAAADIQHPPPTLSAAFTAQGQAAGNKLMPFIGYPGIAMWQFLPPATVDTSQDHVLRPPVA